jgi:hypothetical protein
LLTCFSSGTAAPPLPFWFLLDVVADVSEAKRAG